MSIVAIADTTGRVLGSVGEASQQLEGSSLQAASGQWPHPQIS